MDNVGIRAVLDLASCTPQFSTSPEAGSTVQIAREAAEPALRLSARPPMVGLGIVR